MHYRLYVVSVEHLYSDDFLIDDIDVDHAGRRMQPDGAQSGAPCPTRARRCVKHRAEIVAAAATIDQRQLFDLRRQIMLVRLDE